MEGKENTAAHFYIAVAYEKLHCIVSFPYNEIMMCACGIQNDFDVMNKLT